MHRRSSSLRGSGCGFHAPQPTGRRREASVNFVPPHPSAHGQVAGSRWRHRSPLPKVGQCALRMSWPRSRPACGTGTPPPARSRSTRRRPGCSACPRARQPTEAQARARLHPVDWNEITGVVELAVAEGTLAEVRVRIMDERGQVLRTVRSRSKPSSDRATRQRGVRPLRHAPGGRRAAPGTPRRAQRGHRGLAALPGGVPAGRGPRAGRGALHRGGPAGRRALSMPGFSPDGLAVFGVEGERLTIIGHHGQQQGDETPSPTWPWTPTIRPPRSSAPAARSTCPPPTSTAPLPGHLAARPALRPPVLGVPATGGRPHDGRVDGGLQPTRSPSPRTSARCWRRWRGCWPRRWPAPGVAETERELSDGSSARCCRASARRSRA
ncbi:hypothetical protein SBADM41S_11349 [Streptomyces badius]